ncbi:hypothetical protein, partial [Corynebacterium glutamicum]|uniref:hypothetical protein n=1 Tax=Corynebacterium glutamicum TaxID=1718 RepID=UPI00095FE933
AASVSGADTAISNQDPHSPTGVWPQNAAPSNFGRKFPLGGPESALSESRLRASHPLTDANTRSTIPTA